MILLRKQQIDRRRKKKFNRKKSILKNTTRIDFKKKSTAITDNKGRRIVQKTFQKDKNKLITRIKI